MRVGSIRIRRLSLLTLVLFLFWFVASGPIQAHDDTRWDVFTSTSGEGPVGDEITSLVQDGDTLWVGTTNGLSRYDGGTWDTYTMAEGLPADAVRALLIDKQGYLWIGTVRGVLLLGPGRRWADKRLLTSEPMEIMALNPAAGGGVWIGALEGVFYCSSPSATACRRIDDLPDNAVEAIWEKAVNDVWFGTRGGGVIHYRSDGAQTHTVTHGLPSPWVHALWGDDRGDLWVGTQEGACRLSLANPGAGCRALDPLRGLSINGFFPGPDDSVWAATSVGMWRFHGDRLLETIRTTSETALRSDDVRVMTQDAEGQIWLGTTGGLTRRRVQLWVPFLPDSPDLRENDVQAIAEDAAGNLWVATARGLKWRNATGQWQSVARLAGEPVRCLWAEVDGSLWLCRKHGIARVWPSGQIEFPADDRGLIDLTVNGIHRGPDGALWLATMQGVWRWDGATLTPYRQGMRTGGPVNNAVYSIAPDRASGLWFGTQGGLSHWSEQGWVNPTQAGCPVTDLVEALASDQLGRLWIGTNNGLILCGAGQQRRWTVDDGIITNRIRVLALEIVNGEASSTVEQMMLWLGTFDGLSRANISQDAGGTLPVVSFTGASLPHDRVQAIHASRRYGVLIGTPNGLWSYQPSPAPPQVRLQQRSAGNVTFDTMLQPDLPLELAHDAPAALFAVGGDLRTPSEDLIYRYALEASKESNQGWSLNGDLPITDTDMLRPGEMITVAVWAYDRDFNQSVNPARLQVTRRSVPLVNQPWFPYFLILMVPVLIGTTVLVTRIARARRAYGYHDVGVSLVARAELVLKADIPAAHHVQLYISRDRRLFEYECTVDAALLQEHLDRLRKDRTDESLRDLGKLLYAGLFSPEVSDHLKKHVGLGSKGVRLRLRFKDVPHLAALPWEFLHGGDDLDFLTSRSHVALVRDLSPEEPAKLPRTRPPLKLLIAWATPQDLAWLEVDDEVKAIEAALAPSVASGRVNIRKLPHATLDMFIKFVQEGYDLIHFIGHGGVKDGIGVLYFEDEDGDAVSMTQDELVTLLREAPTFTDKTPKLAILDACRTAETGDIEGSLGLAAALVTKARLPATVGMGYPITGDAAAIFSKAFYETLVRHGQVDYAVAIGRKTLFTRMGPDKRDWGIPRLYTRTREGIIFELT